MIDSAPANPQPSPATGTEPVPKAVRGEEPCWSTVGVRGNGTCTQLTKHGHCRNCPTFSEAGLRLLDEPLPDGYRQQWTRHFAERKREFESSDASALAFRIHNEWFAMPTQAFQEVAEQRAIHSLPHHRRGLLLGLANVRGELVVCVSLGHLLGVHGVPGAEVLRRSYQRLLIGDWQGSRFGFPVDEVPGTQRLRLQDLMPPPTTVTSSTNTYTQGVFKWRDNTVGLLHPDMVFSTLNECLK